ncbi:co-chaperone GroES [bacterium]|nr:co-chaperone GroES [bacterium]
MAKKLNIKPLSNRVLVKRLEEELQTTAGGIIVPDTAKEKPQRGKIVAVGPGRMNDEGKRISMDVKAGDQVLFGKWSGSEITVDGEEYLFMKDDDILAVL